MSHVGVRESTTYPPGEVRTPSPEVYLIEVWKILSLISHHIAIRCRFIYVKHTTSQATGAEGFSFQEIVPPG